MLSQSQNERLTRVGPGTPMGNLLRRYWHPVAVASELEANPVKRVRLLCEDLVLYRDRSGTLGLIDEPCPHRRVSMEYGIPEQGGLRCPYHGWLFNHEGRCTEQPAEPWDSTFRDRVTTKAYPVQGLGGLVFAYLGPQPAPLLPRYDVYVWDDVVRHVGATRLPCNWVQAMENSLDPTHAEWLHGYYMDYVNRRKGYVVPNRLSRKHKKIGFDRFEHGIVKRRVLEGETEAGTQWTVGHPIIFPNMLRIGAASDYSFQIRVPIDDTHTWHLHYLCYRPGIPVPPQTRVPLYEIPLYEPSGQFITDFVIGQDHFAWISQGPIAARDQEHLGQSDIGVIMFRELLNEQIERVERGEDPMEVYRDPAANQLILLPQEESPYGDTPASHDVLFTAAERRRTHLRFDADFDEVQEMFQRAKDAEARGQAVFPPPNLPVVPVGARLHRQVQILQ